MHALKPRCGVSPGVARSTRLCGAARGVAPVTPRTRAADASRREARPLVFPTTLRVQTCLFTQPSRKHNQHARLGPQRRPLAPAQGQKKRRVGRVLRLPRFLRSRPAASH